MVNERIVSGLQLEETAMFDRVLWAAGALLRL